MSARSFKYSWYSLFEPGESNLESLLLFLLFLLLLLGPVFPVALLLRPRRALVVRSEVAAAPHAPQGKLHWGVARRKKYLPTYDSEQSFVSRSNAFWSSPACKGPIRIDPPSPGRRLGLH